MPASGSGGARTQAEVFFEMRNMGGQMRVAAIDSATGTEVVVIAPLSLTEKQMQTLALNKLRRRLQAEAK